MEQEMRFDPATDDMLLDLTPMEPAVVEYRVVEEVVAPRQGLLNAELWQIAVKRLMDIVLSALAIVVLTPVLVAVALLIMLTSRGPVFYVQERVGRGGGPFRMLKFRSMYRDAHEHRHEHSGQNIHQGPIFKIRDDPRITPVGRAMRRLSIDEFPQFFNVLMGSMSLVGPRPALPDEFLDYNERERERLLAKPGVTCIWQVSGRSDVDFDTWIDMDLQYIEEWSLRTDLKLLFKTVPAVLTGRGAY
jgi:lipopolysaccharide/colanic/teichoic acid biosynthesis glycosyltransferase